MVTGATPLGREVLRHSTAHVLAQAVLRLWPGAHFAIGPVIEDGFYYDFELPGGAHFTDEDLERIAAEMRAIMAEDQPFVRHEHSISEGLELFGDQPFKREIIEAVGAGQDEVDAARRARASTGCPPTGTRPPSPTCAAGRTCPPTSALGHFALDAGGRRLLAGRREAPAAPADLRHGVGVRRGAWPTTSTGWRRPRSATTASSASSSTCSASPTSSAADWPCGTRRVASSAS